MKLEQRVSRFRAMSMPDRSNYNTAHILDQELNGIVDRSTIPNPWYAHIPTSELLGSNTFSAAAILYA